MRYIRHPSHRLPCDELGHAAGDALLQRFSELLRKYLPSSDIFRISGDAFVILRPNAKEDGLISDVGRLKSISGQQDIASVGCTMRNGSDLFKLVSVAEKDMYAIKTPIMNAMDRTDEEHECSLRNSINNRPF